MSIAVRSGEGTGERMGEKDNIRNTSWLLETTEFLKQYAFGRRLLDMNRYEREYFSEPDDDGLHCTDDEAYIKAKMFRIKRFVTSLPADNRKLFLYYHYIHGETVERCGELLHISRRSAYRLKQRALEFAALKYKKFDA